MLTMEYQTPYGPLRQDNYMVVLRCALVSSLENVAKGGQVPDREADVFIDRGFNKILLRNLSTINRILPLLSEAKVPKKSVYITVCNSLIGLTKNVYDYRHSHNTVDLMKIILHLKNGCRIMAKELLEIIASA